MNPQEIPEAYDISKVEDLGKLSNNLTLEERITLREKFIQEKQTIIYLTQTELSELQSTLSSENNHHTERVERVASFLEQQKSEGFSLTDIIPAESVFSEQIGNAEKLVGETLFGNEGILKDMNLSDTAQNIFASGMSLALIEEMGKNPSSIDLSGLMKDPQDLSSLETLVRKILPLGSLAQQKESVGMGSIEVSKLHISGNGESNTLFQNPLEAQKLIAGIFSGEITEEKLEAYIEAKNDKPAANIDVKTIQEHLQKNLGAIEARLKSPQTTQDPQAAAQEAAAAAVPDATEGEKEGIFQAFLKLFKEFVEGFIGIGEEVLGPLNTNNSTSNNKPDAGNETNKPPENNPIDLQGKTIQIISGLEGIIQSNTAISDIQKPTQTEILSILKSFQNSDFSDVKKQPENSAQAIYAIQVALSNQGIDAGIIDGVFGPKTQEGIKSYQKSLGLSETGKIDENLFSKLVEKFTPATPEK